MADAKQELSEIDIQLKIGATLVSYYKLDDEQRVAYFIEIQRGRTAFEAIDDFLRWSSEGKIEAFMPEQLILPTIRVRITEVEPKAMYLHEHLGSGTLDDVKFDASTIVQDRSLLVSVGGKRYTVDTQQLVTAIIDYHLATAKPAK